LSTSKSAPVTIEQLESYIKVTAYCMERHKLPQILPTLKRLIAARDDLLANGDPLEFARRILESGTIDVQPGPFRNGQPRLSGPNCSNDPNQPSAHDAS
jgi:hypothetical protein